MNRYVFGALFIVACGGLFCWWLITSDKSTPIQYIEIVRPTPVLSKFVGGGMRDFSTDKHVIKTLKPGSSVRVLGVRYGKDYRAFRIKYGAGKVGYCVDDKGVKTVPNKN